MYIFKSKAKINKTKLNKVCLQKSNRLTGNVTMPGDKSISQRSLISLGKTVIKDILDSQDVYHTLKAVESLGAKIKINRDHVEIRGVGIGNLISPKQPIYMGNSGTGTRLLLGLVAGSNALVTFYGDESLSNRPMDRVIEPLEQMGASVVCSKSKKLPITVTGARARGITMPINYKLSIPSAQIKSAILLAALSARGKTYITEYKKTRNYTEKMLAERGACLKVNNTKNGKSSISIEGASHLKSKNIKIPGDPSSAVFLAVAAIITKNSSITIENVLLDRFRLNVFKILQKMGANIKITKVNTDTCKIEVKSSKLNNIIIKSDKSASLIDEYPILSVAAACGQGKMMMEGLEELRFKESDRFSAIVKGLSKTGVQTDSFKNNILIKGCKNIKGGCIIDAKNDHRIAMAFNILSLVSEKPIIVKGNHSILTSFPNFFNTLNILGVSSSNYA